MGREPAEVEHSGAYVQLSVGAVRILVECVRLEVSTEAPELAAQESSAALTRLRYSARAQLVFLASPQQALSLPKESKHAVEPQRGSALPAQQEAQVSGSRVAAQLVSRADNW